MNEIENSEENLAVDSARTDLSPGAQEVLAALPQVIIQVDDDFRLASVNRPRSTLFRERAEVGTRLEDAFDSEAVEVITALIQNAELTGGAIAEHHAGSDMFRVTAKRLSSVPNTLLVFQNITGISEAGRTLVDLIRYRSNFLASISNELKQPLTAVIGYANLLSDPEAGLEDPAREAMVRDMTDQAWDLAGIVEDLLTVARAELGELVVAKVPVNISANVAQVCESMGTRGTSITVTGDRSVTGVGDPARLRQIVRNLLSNALTHGAEPVRVNVVSNGTGAAVQVIDHGVGLPEELAESAFDQYTSGPTADGPARVGVGLWICRELTHLMGGHLEYRRVDDRTVFEATIPAR